MKTAKTFMVLILLLWVALPVMAQEATPEVTVIEETMIDPAVQDYVSSNLITTFWTAVSMLTMIVAGYVISRVTNTSRTPTMADISKHAITFADLLGYLERLDVTDERVDGYIRLLEDGIRKEAEQMGTTPEVILLKESKE